MSKLQVLCVVATLAVVPGVSFAGPIAVQTFDAPHGWFIGGGSGGVPQLPLPTALGGPTGPTDPFLLITSTGASGPGSRLSAINTTEFTGDFPGAGVTSIGMDLRNFGTADVFLRLLLVDLEGGIAVNAALSTTAVSVSAGSNWSTYIFDLSAGALTALLGTTAGALADVDEFRLFHNPVADFPGTNSAISAVIGVDNIRTGATTPSVPEPAMVTLLAGGISTLLARRRRKVSVFART